MISKVKNLDILNFDAMAEQEEQDRLLVQCEYIQMLLSSPNLNVLFANIFERRRKKMMTTIATIARTITLIVMSLMTMTILMIPSTQSNRISPPVHVLKRIPTQLSC